MPIPELVTERLILRAPRPDDFEPSFAMWRDPVVTRYIGGRPQTREETWGRILRYIGHWQVFGWGFWTVTTRAGAFVGECGFADFHREIAPAIDAPEMGWSLAAAMHGQGYASEAVRAAAQWGDAHIDAPRTMCIIDPDNAASLAVAKKSGFVEATRTTYREAPTVMMQRTPPPREGRE